MSKFEETGEINLQNDIEEEYDKCNEAAWKFFTNWIHCICVVTFDLELGQALEVNKRDVTLFSFIY